MSSFAVESWTWYSVVVCVLIARYTSRIWHFHSILKLKVEDWFMAFLTVMYTILIVFLNVDLNVSTNLINPADPVVLTPQEISDRTYGSKTVLLVEQSMCFIQWGCKGCLLILYWRLTQNLRQHLVVKLVAAYVVTTYCVMIILYFGVWCRPFHDYWQVPTDNTQCTTALHHLIVNLSFNLSSDLMILAIPLPLLLRQKIPWKRKSLMVLPFSLGFFTMACAISSKVASFTTPYSAIWVFWYCREASTTMIVSNMPYAWGLIRKIFKLRSILHESGDDTTLQSSNVQRLEGHRVSFADAPSSAPKSRKRSWFWSRRGITVNRSRQMSGPEVDSPVKANQEDKKEPLELPSSDNSFAGSRAPGKGDAIDRLYDLEAIDDSCARDIETAPQRRYDG